MKKIIIPFLTATLLLVAGCSYKPNQTSPQPNGTSTSVACTLEAKICPDGSAVGRVAPDCEFAACPAETKNIYNNSLYGFSLDLPADWKGYMVSSSSIDKGVKIIIRNPQWTKEAPHEDIPILVYSLAQWTKWEATNFEGYQTAAPIGPQERGRNNLYVLATAPRYNFDFQTGWEEVEAIIKNLKVSNLPEPIIRVDNLLPGSSVKSPLTITGQAPGSWFFEATFPVKIFDSQNKQLGVTTAKAQADWLTENFVPFTAALNFDRPSTNTGYIVFTNDNPSGLAQNEKKLTIPVSFDPVKASSTKK